ncbi:DUF29 domain-containing protein [Massilia arenosa]|uniref:DUF29 domain-containing protein n=1 Tax=Zemynaea arenosa TaxID=2561931 RepID=A0A4Y9S8M0_9BURK|nr:DUF29 domain-containing protein [Massilia arenosa]TFW16828.1 DUF29 domain-containing protein [Massilia arenosa]
MNAARLTDYETDFVAWTSEQAALLRAGKLSDLDLEHIAEEIEDLGRHYKRELGSRLTQLIAHLLKWRYQKQRRSASWMHTILNQRHEIEDVLKDAPSLRVRFTNEDWMETQWRRARKEAQRESHIAGLPDRLPWSVAQILDEDFLPD